MPAHLYISENISPSQSQNLSQPHLASFARDALPRNEPTQLAASEFVEVDADSLFEWLAQEGIEVLMLDSVASRIQTRPQTCLLWAPQYG